MINSIKKVLILSPRAWDYGISVDNAFQDLGYKTHSYCFEDGYLNSICKLLIKPLTLFSGEFNKYYYLNKEILRIYKDFAPDLVFVIKGHRLYQKTLKQFTRSINALWLMDSYFRVKTAIEHKDEYHYIFTFEESDYEKLKTQFAHLHYIPLGYDHKIYFPLNYKEREIDICFVGCLYENRVNLLEKIILRFPELNIKIYGKLPRRDKALLRIVKSYPTKFMNIELNPSEVNELYANSKFALNIHHEQSVLSVNPRFYEILGTNTCQIVDYHEKIHADFAHACLFYKDEKELFSLIEFYLQDQEARDKIALNGYNKVTTQETMKNRIVKILNILERGNNA